MLLYLCSKFLRHFLRHITLFINVKPRMSKKVFFTSSYLQKTIYFDKESEWILLEKLDEEVNQLDELETNRSGTYSYSVAKFLCCKVGEPENKMIMKIFMQYTISPLPLT